LAATAMACEGLHEKMYVRSRSEVTASKSREAGLIMYYSGCDDVSKRQCSFGIIAAIVTGGGSDENHFPLLNPASRDFASRGSFLYILQV
jgi:hypothetical protein